jgi:dTDP-L-rhamnose 4-epimerase
MRVLVTGGAGFIGSHTADLLLSQGYQVRAIDSLAAPVHQNGQLPDYLDARVEFIRGDVQDRLAWESALDGVDFVFHLAAYQDYLPDFSRFFAVNCVSTALLYELIVEKQYPVQKIVVASSQAVYGEGHYECSVHGAQYPSQRTLEQLKRAEWNLICPHCGKAMGFKPTDESIVNPHNPYAISKYSLEMTALNLGKRYGIPTVALRYSITQGPRQSPFNAYSGILRIFTTRLLSGLRPIVYEDGMQLRDYVSVYDVARANLLAMQDGRADYRALNVGTGHPTTVLEYLHMLMEATGVQLEPVFEGQFRLGDTRHIVSDVGALRGLGWEPAVPLPEIMRQYVEWIRGRIQAGQSSLEADETMRRKGVVRTADSTH